MTVVPIEGVLYWYDEASRRFIAPGRPYLPADAATVREGLVYGSYLPVVGETAGLLTEPSQLTELNSPTTQTFTLANGATYENVIIYGDLRPPASHTSDITIRNCLLRGGPHTPTNDDAILNCQSPRSGSGVVNVYDSEFAPQVYALKRDGIRGYRVKVYRSYVHDVIDGCNLWASTSMNSGVSNSGLYGSVVDRLRYMNPDGQHSDGTHNDAVSLNGGGGIVIKGNYLNGTGVDMPGTDPNPTHPQIQAAGFAYGAGIIFTNTVSNPPDDSVIVEENWIRGFNAHFNIKPDMTAIVRNNRHYRAVFVGSTSSGYWVRYDRRAGNQVVVTSDTWVDGPYAGQVLTEPRDRGIHYNS